MEDKKKSPSWVAIVIWFIFFWPVGVYLVIKKLSTDKAAAMKNSKVIMGIGIFFIFGAFVMLVDLIGGDTDTSTGVFGFLFYLVGGVLMIYGSKKIKEAGERYKKYIYIVINQQQHTIENIASQVGLSYVATVKELQKMIDKGYFGGAYIDQDNHEIVLPNKTMGTLVEQDTVFASSAPKQKTVKCSNCGGNNIINIGQVCECDYCGSPIE